MIYKIFNEPKYSPIKQILINRGLSEDKLDEWINAGWPQINSPWLFGEEKVKHAIQLMSRGLKTGQEVWVLVD